jgi:murein peptide amidase A
VSRRWRTVGVVAMVALAACSTSDAGAPADTSVPVTSATPASTSTASTTTSTSSTTTSSTTSSTTTSTTVAPVAVAERPADFLGEEVIGTSAGGRDITAWHRGTEGGTVILVVGVIHGNENAGLPILDRLGELPVPAGYDLWLLPLMNPDGYVNDVRGNEHGVDLNRNFPHDWTPIAQQGDWQWSGTGPASEPETQAFIAFTQRVQPALTLWYHQDLYRVSPSSGRDGPLRQRYAELTGLPYETVSGVGSVYTGVAATWTRRTLPDAMSFIVELGPTLPADEVDVHANAVLAIAQMV